MNLYRLETEGLGTWWVVAPDPTKAQQELKKILDAGDGYGFTKDRRVIEIHLISEGIRHTGAKMLPYNLSKENRFLCI